MFYKGGLCLHCYNDRWVYITPLPSYIQLCYSQLHRPRVWVEGPKRALVLKYLFLAMEGQRLSKHRVGLIWLFYRGERGWYQSIVSHKNRVVTNWNNFDIFMKWSWSYCFMPISLLNSQIQITIFCRYMSAFWTSKVTEVIHKDYPPNLCQRKEVISSSKRLQCLVE